MSGRCNCVASRERDKFQDGNVYLLQKMAVCIQSVYKLNTLSRD